MAAILGVSAAVVAAGASTAQATGAGSGLYGTLTDIYSQTTNTVNSVASGQTNLGTVVSGAAQTAGNILSGGTSAVTGGVVTGGAITGGTVTTGGTATVNGRRVIEYYPLGHYETYVTGGTTGEGTATGSAGTQDQSSQTVKKTELTGFAQISVDDETYQVKIADGKITATVSDNSASKPLQDAGTVEFTLGEETLKVTVNNDQFTVEIGGQSATANLSRTTSDVSGNSSTAAAATAAGGTATGTQAAQSTQQVFVRDIHPLESNPVGPILSAVGLAESYHENYQIYEERFSDLYAIYTNIPSGSITNRPAIFDVPNGVSVRMTRDGRSVPFANKEQIKEEGTYVLQFYVLQDGSEDLPAWQQTIERGRFTFRVQYTAGLDGSPLVVNEPSELESFADMVQEESEVLLPGIVEEPGAEEGPAGSGETGEAGEAGGESAGEEQETREQPSDIVSATGGLSTAWDEDAGYYRISLLTGDSFTANIPDGMVTNSSVLFLPEDDIRMELYRGAEQIDYTAGDFITEAGDYTLIPVIDNLDYESYYRMNRPMMRFRIVTGSVNDLGAFTAPEATQIAAVRLGGADVTDRVMLTEKTAVLSEDGAWEIDLTGGSGNETVYLTRDTTPPAVNIKTEPNAARITYLSEDIAGATLTRGSERISDGQLVTLVTDAGRYQLTVRDAAGNETVKEFSVQYRINAFAIIAIVAVVALIGALIIFLRRVRTSVRVR